MKQLFDQDDFRERITKKVELNREQCLREFQNLQIVAYVMAGGGFVGRSAAEQPWGFYVDGRVSKRPYSITKIGNAVASLRIFAEVLGFTTNTMPRMPDFPNCGVF